MHVQFLGGLLFDKIYVVLGGIEFQDDFLATKVVEFFFQLLKYISCFSSLSSRVSSSKKAFYLYSFSSSSSNRARIDFWISLFELGKRIDHSNIVFPNDEMWREDNSLSSSRRTGRSTCKWWNKSMTLSFISNVFSIRPLDKSICTVNGTIVSLRVFL